MKCPYCNMEFELFSDSDVDVNPVHTDRLYNSKRDCWDVYLCECPKCEKTFRAFEFYIFDGQGTEKMEDE